MLRKTIKLVVNPSLLALLYVRFLSCGEISFFGASNRYNEFIINKLYPFLSLCRIKRFNYNIGLGGFGYNYFNTVYKLSAELAEEVIREGGDKQLLEVFNNNFKTKAFPLVWKKMIGCCFFDILVAYNGLVHNFSTENIYIYFSKNSKEYLAANAFFEKFPGFKVSYRYIPSIPLLNLTTFLFYYVYVGFALTKRGGIRLRVQNRKIYKVMLEATHPSIDDNCAFSLLEWWDRKTIDKNDILFFSHGRKGAGRVNAFRSARKKQFQCISLKEVGKVPINKVKSLFCSTLVFPAKNINALLKSNHLDFYFKFLTQFYLWSIFYYYFKVGVIILPTADTDCFETIISNYYGTESVKYHHSYLATFEDPLIKYLHTNNLLLWGNIQASFMSNNNYIDNIHYTGCHVLSYYDNNKRLSLLSRLKSVDVKKKNIVFFDNKVDKNAASSEQSYFSYLELVIQCADIFDANIIFRPKVPDPFNTKRFNDKKRLTRLSERLENADIPVLSAQQFDVMSVISIADIVVYSMIGTPSMMALMLDIPALSYYDYIEETPDPIMKHYLNELIFDDQEKLIKKIEKILKGEELPRLRKEDKRKLNHYLDNKGLTRMQSIVADIVNDKEPQYSVKNIGE